MKAKVIAVIDVLSMVEWKECAQMSQLYRLWWEDGKFYGQKQLDFPSLVPVSPSRSIG